MKLIREIFLFLIIPLISLNAQTTGQYKYFTKEEQAKRKAAGQEISVTYPAEYIPLEMKVDPENYIVGPRDEFVISILSDEIKTFTIQISPTGDILIPGVGTTNVSRQYLKDVYSIIDDMILSVYSNTKVFITLRNPRIFRVLIYGAVNSPGYYQISPVERLSDLVERAEGFHQLAKEFDIRIYRNDGSERAVDIFRFYVDGDISHNPTFLEGDRVFVPFGNPEKESILVRGAVKGVGYDIIREKETLLSYIKRSIRFGSSMDIERVKILRKDESGNNNIISLPPGKFNTFILKSGDSVEFLSQLSVKVTGYVNTPGAFSFIPGLKAFDYISMAGGNSPEGDTKKSVVRHETGQIEKGEEVQIQQGDVIYVPRSRSSILYGDMSLLQFISILASLYLTFVAATK